MTNTCSFVSQGTDAEIIYQISMLHPFCVYIYLRVSICTYTHMYKTLVRQEDLAVNNNFKAGK